MQLDKHHPSEMFDSADWRLLISLDGHKCESNAIALLRKVRYLEKLLTSTISLLPYAKTASKIKEIHLCSS